MLLRNTILTALCLVIAMANTAFGQQSRSFKLDAGAAGTIALYEGDPNWAYGAFVKGLWPIGKKDNALVGGIDYDRLSELYGDERYTYKFFLGSFGFRKTLNPFFIEFKAGIGVTKEGNYTSATGFVGIEPGVQLNWVGLSLCYRLITADDLIYGEQFNMFSLRAGFRILGNRKQ
ncbi:hypothetical protein [Flavihumibacter petaseus]|uniref:Outer membrane protein beta-barrel domain-containing protein n=1 Tax=Flavihumibacter petaseus NBRC 106054 TaxID=1220578 RepID=A0A0E9MXY7_9BACT|nr:hypothetical protein [Flavihumibacter petaseus]GAO42301.1 hypothetical protein FPE01S_01_13140 [Flavihumibacter petaseus NBRC 106054]